jgi:predicted O-methyltransferase YrrM
MKREEILEFILDAGSDDVETFGGEFQGGIQCQQVPDEFADFIFDVLQSELKVENYLEIGAAQGGTTYLISHLLKPKNIVLVDDNLHAKHKTRQQTLEGITRREIIGNSRDADVIAEVKDKYDMIFIDGDHSFYGVKTDAENYLPMLNVGGLVAFHDSMHDGECAGDAFVPWGVKKYVTELKEKAAKGKVNFQFVNEYISKTHPRPCGIAVFRKVKE